AEEPDAAQPEAAQPAMRVDAASAALAARIAELGTQPKWVDMSEREIATAGEGGANWPPLDLPSPPPPPLEGPPPDPETLLAEAAALIAEGDYATARDRMLIAAMVHREAGRLDAALEVCLQLLTTAPGDPQVHLAIANLQLDRGWTVLATEKIELLKRLTALTGDTQAEADVHGLASERLRDDAASTSRGR
ncbi:MAG: tetratricopeptide repeat protein, partial [Chloroflexota bacterium]